MEAEGYITGVKAYDNVLKIKAASVTGTTTPALGNNSAIRVYASESDAKTYGDNHLAEVTRSTLLNNETNIALTGLTAESVLYFAYKGSTHIYVASATAGALAGATAEIAFNDSYEMPLRMSAEFGNGTQYYGTGKTFTLTFTTNKAGTYTLASNVLTFTSNTTGVTVTTNNQFTVNAAGTYTFTCTTTTWSTKASVTISKPNDNTSSSNSVTATGVERSMLKIQVKAGSNAPSSGTTVYLYNSSDTRLYSGNWSTITGGTAEIEIKNLTDWNTAVGYFQYSSGGWFNQTTYKTDSLNAEQLTSGNTTVNFGS